MKISSYSFFIMFLLAGAGVFCQTNIPADIVITKADLIKAGTLPILNWIIFWRDW